MKPSDIFGIVVRTIGVCLFLWGLWYLVFGIAESVGLLQEQAPDDTKLLLLTGVGSIVVAVWLMRAASWFVNFTYPEDAPRTNESTS